MKENVISILPYLEKRGQISTSSPAFHKWGKRNDKEVDRIIADLTRFIDAYNYSITRK